MAYFDNCGIIPQCNAGILWFTVFIVLYYVILIATATGFTYIYDQCFH